MQDSTASYIIWTETKEGNRPLREAYKSAKKSVCYVGKMGMF